MLFFHMRALIIHSNGHEIKNSEIYINNLKFYSFYTFTSGLIILKKSLNNLNYEFRSNLNLTASLYYCYQSTAVAQQKISFNLLNVNKYPPRINIQVFFILLFKVIKRTGVCTYWSMLISFHLLINKQN